MEKSRKREVELLEVPAARIVFDEADRDEVADMVRQALLTGALTLGPFTRSFEKAFAERHGAAHAVAVSSGTAALEIILRTVGVAGRDVVVPANTFYATAGAVVHAGGRPVFADIAPDTFALSAGSLEAALTDRTVAVLLVHIGGVITAEVDVIRGICERRGVTLIEDAAHAHGCSFDGRSAGGFGAAAAFSFYPTKLVTTGEGGMILTSDERVRDEAVTYRDQGKAGFTTNDHVRFGYAWRMSELAAATGLVHLRALDRAMSVRQAVAARYDQALGARPELSVLRPPGGAVSNYYKYAVLLPPGTDRVAVKEELRRRGVSPSGEVYATPLHHQPVFSGRQDLHLPHAEDVCARQVCLPVHSDMTPEEAEFTVTTFVDVLDDLGTG